MGNEVDYCKDCGCPLDICCKKQGAIEELVYLLIVFENTFKEVKNKEYFIRFLKMRLKKLKK